MRRETLIATAGLALIAGGARAEGLVKGEGVEEIVVVGTRGAPRLATETAAPVDLISGDELRARGFDSLSKVLHFVAPSFNVSHGSLGPSSVGTRPATLRGMGPDQVLVLINGKRRHAASVINTNNGIGRGTVPVDLNTIPMAAIERIEILRDGAAAQYGSDAIAGVINIVLRHDAEGGMGAVLGGVTERGDGQTGTATARQGFKLGEEGFLTVTGEARYRNYTNAAVVDPRVGRVTQRHGDPRSSDIDLTANSEIPLSSANLYGFATFARRHTESGSLFRLPSVAPTFYPDGFLPLIEQDTYDFGGTVGGRGSLGPWTWDLSDTVGYNRTDFDVSSTVNTSLGAASPTAFDGGGVRYGQNLVNLTVDRGLALLAGAHIAAGIEHRYEQYEMRAGEPSSYQGAGAQGFPGYNPPSPVDVNRTALSVFIDGELSLIEGLDLGLAGRYEDYSDFGSEATGKASLFWRPAALVAFRATASTGFRAPSLQQQYFSTVTSQLSNGVLVNVGNFAVSDPVSRALGASPLKPETSKNYSVGLVFTPSEQLTLTADAYRIVVHDRISLSESLAGPAVTAILAASGITNASQVRFFTNAADTRTSGFETSAHWTQPLSDTAVLGLSLGYGTFKNRITQLRQNPVLPNLPLLALTSIEAIVDAQPADKLTFNGNLSWGRAHFSADVVRFGHTKFAPLGVFEQTFGAVTTVDLSTAYDITDAVRIELGVINATDQYPDEVVGAFDGRIYLEVGGVGINGREYFLRMTSRF